MRKLLAMLMSCLLAVSLFGGLAEAHPYYGDGWHGEAIYCDGHYHHYHHYHHWHHWHHHHHHSHVHVTVHI